MTEQNEQEIIKRNRELNPRKELADYLGYVAKQAGFSFESDNNVVEKHFRYTITGSFPCEVQGNKCSLGFKTRDVEVGNIYGGTNRILDRWNTLSYGGQRCAGEIVEGYHLIKAEIQEGIGMFFGLGTGLDSNDKRYGEWQQRIIQAREYVITNFPELGLLAGAPRYFALRTYQGNPRQLSEAVQEEIRRISTPWSKLKRYFRG